MIYVVFRPFKMCNIFFYETKHHELYEISFFMAKEYFKGKQPTLSCFVFFCFLRMTQKIIHMKSNKLKIYFGIVM